MDDKMEPDLWGPRMALSGQWQVSRLRRGEWVQGRGHQMHLDLHGETVRGRFRPRSFHTRDAAQAVADRLNTKD